MRRSQRTRSSIGHRAYRRASDAPLAPRLRGVHILVLTDRDWTHPQGGGTGTNLYGQVSRWLAWGHRVSVIAAGYDGAEPVERIGELTMYRVGGRSTVFPHAIWKQWRGLVPDADVVLEVINGITFLTPIWLKRPHPALAHHVHGEHSQRGRGPCGGVAALSLEPPPLKPLSRGSGSVAIPGPPRRDLGRFGIPPDNVTVDY